MNTPTQQIFPWPQTLHTDAAGRRWIEGGDGRRIELDAFKATCQRRAVELRGQAMGEAMDAVAGALRRTGRWIWRGLRPAHAPLLRSTP